MYNTHSFSVELATTLGLEKTLILQHFFYWHQANADNENMYKDNAVWFFTSRKNIMGVFPYLTERKIRSAIDELVDSGYVRKGNYSTARKTATGRQAQYLPQFFVGDGLHAAENGARRLPLFLAQGRLFPCFLSQAHIAQRLDITEQFGRGGRSAGPGAPLPERRTAPPYG